MNDLIPSTRIESKIYFIRGKKVMLDRDLAELYGVRARRLREQVKRNLDRFPPDFMFQLSQKETALLVSHFATPSKKRFGGHLPYVFTEHGALMLSSVLRTQRANKVGILIVRAFIKMREMLSSHKELKEKIEVMERKYDRQFRIVFKAIKSLLQPIDPKKKQIGFIKEEE